jgi:gas vesicle protein
MADDRNSNASSIAMAFLLGGLAGAALAVLYAPRSGRETRELLGEKIREGAERGRQMKDRAVARGREMYDDATDYVEKQREGLDKRKERLASAIEAGRQAYREEKDKM